MGCNGGNVRWALRYVKKAGITSENVYPYFAERSGCDRQKAKQTAYTISSFKDIKKGDCSGLTDAVNTQPISIAVDARNWQFYSSGVFNDCKESLDHAVLLVGYDAAQNWIVKNSWASNWGENGYIRLSPGNTCGLCNSATYTKH